MILALDTALETCSVSLFDKGEMLSFISEPMAKGHAERLIPMMQEVFEKASVSPSNLTLIAVTTGPGSFTGLRVALAAARALGAALEIKVIGVNTLDALAKPYGEREVLTLIDARHEKCYAQLSKGNEIILPPALYENATLKAIYDTKKHILAGSGAKFLSSEIGVTQIDIASVAALALENRGGEASPFYLKEADVTPQIKGIIQRA